MKPLFSYRVWTVVAAIALVAVLAPIATRPLAAELSSGIECGCARVGPYTDPDEGAAPAVNDDWTSPNHVYLLSATGSGPVNLTITRITTGATVLSTSVPANTSWGFSPDDDRFVYHNTTMGVHNVYLYDLATSPAHQVKAIAVSTLSSSISFTTNGHFLLYTALTAASHTMLEVVDVVSGAVAYQTEFTFQSPPGTPGDSYGVAGWGFSPDSSDRTFVYAWVSGANSVMWNVVNLATQTLVHSKTILSISAFWQFSPCGEVVGVVKQPNGSQVEIQLLHTADGTAAGVDQLAALADVALRSTASSHIVNVGGTDYTLTANTASTACPVPATPTATPAPPTADTLTLDTSNVTGGNSTTGRVTLSSVALAGGSVVTLSSNQNSVVTVPSSVIVTAGASGANFSVQTSPVMTAISATISAEAGGVTRMASLLVEPVVIDLLTLSPNFVIGGGSVSGTVSLGSLAPTGGLTVQISSNQSGVAAVPASVTVLEGDSNASFTVQTSPVLAYTAVTISGTAGGVTKSDTLRVASVIPVAALFDRARVQGGNGATCIVTLNGAASPGGATLTITSSQPSVVTVPASIVVPEGVTSTAFPVQTNQVGVATPVTVTVNGGGATRTATLRVLASPVYTVTDIGQGAATDVNSFGEVVGYLGSDGNYSPFDWQAGILTNLSTLDRIGGTAVGVNDSGQVVGSVWNDLSDWQSYRAVVWQDSGRGASDSMGTLGGSLADARGINNGGEAVGWSSTAGGNSEAFHYDNANGMRGIGTLGATPSQATAINNLGQAVGYSYVPSGGRHAFIYSSGVITDLGTLGGNLTFPRGINDAGEVVGYAQTAGGALRAYRYSTSSMTIAALGTLGGNNSYAYDINLAGEIVGSSQDSTGATHAFIVSDGVMTDLNDLIDADAGWELSAGNGINAAQQIAGEGTLNGQSRAVLLTRLSEPATTPTPTVSATSTATPTATPTRTATATPSATATQTFSATPSPSASPTATATPWPYQVTVPLVDRHVPLNAGQSADGAHQSPLATIAAAVANLFRR